MREVRGDCENFNPFRVFKYPCFELNGRNATDVLLESANIAWNYYTEQLYESECDPEFIAWTTSYEVEAFVNIYRITNDTTWIDRAVSRADYIADRSDMNGDGVPSWGKYNITHSIERTVWDGMICTALMNLVKIIYEDRKLSMDQNLTSKAERYLNLTKRVVERYHNCWIQTNVDEGYYPPDPNNKSDTRIIFNQFLALGSAEILVYEVTGNMSYLEKPLAMAKLFKRHLSFNESLRAYVWPYMVDGRVEDLDHGAIDVNFVILAHTHGLVFNVTDMHYFVHTFTRLLWRGAWEYPYLNTHVDGTLHNINKTLDQRPFHWIKLADFNSLVWFYSWVVLNDCAHRKGNVADRTALLATTELFLFLPELRRLAADTIIEALLYLENFPIKDSETYLEAETHINLSIKAYDEGNYEQALCEAIKCIEIIPEFSSWTLLLFTFLAPFPLIFSKRRSKHLQNLCSPEPNIPKENHHSSSVRRH
ncbi:MAG: hypothetical protein QW791_09170 [Candidatus Bathyarchaeia archaeon]